jgi:peptidyl-prolyl cis-trans isomerase B (cyclophilin B)
MRRLPAGLTALTALLPVLLTAVLLLSPAAAVRAQGPPAAAAGSVKHPIVTMETTKGTIKIKLFPEEAPITVDNFVKLINKGFYNGLMFHRVEPGFVIQGGDPKSKNAKPGDPGLGSGGPGYSIKNEANKLLKHNRGAVAMANAGRDTAGSQFYIVITKPAPFLDEKEADGVNKYTIFGQVIAGQDVAEKIAVGDRIKKVTVATPK